MKLSVGAEMEAYDDQELATNLGRSQAGIIGKIREKSLASYSNYSSRFD